MAVLGDELQVAKLILQHLADLHGGPARPLIQLVVKCNIRVGIRVCATLGTACMSSSAFLLFLLIFVVVAE